MKAWRPFWLVAILALLVGVAVYFMLPRYDSVVVSIRGIPTVSNVNRWYPTNDNDFLSGKIDVAVTLKDGTKVFLQGVEGPEPAKLRYTSIGRFGDYYVELYGNPDELPSAGQRMRAGKSTTSVELHDGLSEIEDFKRIIAGKSVVDLFARISEVREIIDRVPLMTTPPATSFGSVETTREYFKTIPTTFVVHLEGVEFRVIRYVVTPDGPYSDF